MSLPALLCYYRPSCCTGQLLSCLAHFLLSCNAILSVLPVLNVSSLILPMAFTGWCWCYHSAPTYMCMAEPHYNRHSALKGSFSKYYYTYCSNFLEVCAKVLLSRMLLQLVHTRQLYCKLFQRCLELTVAAVTYGLMVGEVCSSQTSIYGLASFNACRYAVASLVLYVTIQDH